MFRTFSSLQFWLTLKPSSQTSGAELKGIATKVSQLLSPCVLGHGNMLKTRDEEGYLALQCEDCGHVKRVLEQPAIKGPMLHAAPVKGAPQTTAKRLVTPERRYPRSA